VYVCVCVTARFALCGGAMLYPPLNIIAKYVSTNNTLVRRRVAHSILTTIRRRA